MSDYRGFGGAALTLDSSWGDPSGSASPCSMLQNREGAPGNGSVGRPKVSGSGPSMWPRMSESGSTSS